MKRTLISFSIILAIIIAGCTSPAQLPVKSKLDPTATSPRIEIPTLNSTEENNNRSKELDGIIEQESEEGSCVVHGIVRYTGQPIINYTSVPPRFWVRDENQGDAFETEGYYDPKTAEYLYTLPAGTFGISANVVLGERYPSPGDYTSFTTVSVEEGQANCPQDIELKQIIHLTSPFDNTLPWDSGFVRKNSWDTPILEDGKVFFSWDAIPEASTYLLTVTEVQYNPAKNILWENIQTHFDVMVTDTQIEIELPTNPDDHFYSARLYAKDSVGNIIGQVMISLKSGGYGWDVRFRVP